MAQGQLCLPRVSFQRGERKPCSAKEGHEEGIQGDQEDKESIEKEEY